MQHIKSLWRAKHYYHYYCYRGTLESPLDCKEIPVNPKGNQSWTVIGRTDAETEAPILWPPDVKNWLHRKTWCWERLKAGGEGDDRGWDGWMASLTWWMWVWASSRSWWRTGKPGMLHSMGSQSQTWLSNSTGWAGLGPSSRKKKIQNFYFYQAFVGLSI